MRIPDLTEKQKEDVIDQFMEYRYLGEKKRKVINDLMSKYQMTYSQIWNLCIIQERTRLIRRMNHADKINQK